MSNKEKICPLMSVGRFEAAPCTGKRCAWWDRLIGACCMESGAGSIRDVGNQINALNIILEGTPEQAEG